MASPCEMPAGVSGFISFHVLPQAEHFTMPNRHYFTFCGSKIFHCGPTLGGAYQPMCYRPFKDWADVGMAQASLSWPSANSPSRSLRNGAIYQRNIKPLGLQSLSQRFALPAPFAQGSLRFGARLHLPRAREVGCRQGLQHHRYTQKSPPFGGLSLFIH